uniref:Small ribosomal subunit protein uS15c n=1 Tax=Arundo donax TaxID=35708 RepID=A0A0A9GSC5_ARUDO
MQMSLLSNIGGQSMVDYMRLPPQEELLERYFHRDHMSSEEKMKLELQKVRDEFKMSENDCGSARVQIAQLTVKIKHLSSVLHKKDKHSKKGLQDMVQRRKKYLKYLRRTDWDSYCLVLSKLGLRDVPEYKAPDYKNKSVTKAKSKKSKSKKKRKVKA